MAFADQTLTDTINALIQEKTFSLDGLDAIKALRDKAAKLESDLSGTKQDLRIKEGALKDKDDRITAYSLRESAITGREKAVADREAKITELEKTTAVASAVSGVWSDAFKTIFKNTIVRESVSRSIPIATVGGSYMQTASGSDNTTRETE